MASSSQATATPLSPPCNDAYGAGEAEVAWKIARSMVELRDWQGAANELASVPVPLRSSAACSMLGGLHLRLGQRRAAQAAFRQCLKLHPAAIEAAMALADLGVPYHEIAAMSPQLAGAMRHAPSGAQCATPGATEAQQDQDSQGTEGLFDGMDDQNTTPRPNEQDATADARRALLEFSPARLIARVSMQGTPTRSSRAAAAGAALAPPVPPAAATRAGLSENVHEQRPLVDRIGGKTRTAHRSPSPSAAVRITGRTVKRRKVDGRPVALGSQKLSQIQQAANVTAPRMRGHRARKRGVAAANISSPESCDAAVQATPAAEACDAEACRTSAPKAGTGTAEAAPSSDELLAGEWDRPGLGWAQLLLQGRAHMAAMKARDACAAFSALADLFPGAIVPVVENAQALLAAGDHVAACATFERARQLDPLSMAGLDAYASSLLARGCGEELRHLSRQVGALDLAPVETVMAVMAAFWQSKGQWSKAASCVDRCASCKSASG